MFKSPFEEKKDLIVVSDAFLQQYAGGAEMTLESFLDVAREKYNIHKINCSDLTLDVFNQIMNNFKNAKWLFGNIGNISANVLNMVIFRVKNYDIIECDYKYCIYRSEELHQFKENITCNCHTNLQLTHLISNFYSNAKRIFWMSDQQKEITNNKIRITCNNQITLNSIFEKTHINYIKNLKDNPELKRSNKFIILKSPSWVKGYDQAFNYCKKNNIEYEEVWNLEYSDLLKKLRTSKGLVYLPNGKDTCPRLVIEAKLLGCELVLNDNVQHKDEEWFENSDTIYENLYNKLNLIKEIF
tara:strand:+ start:1601 stop:2497 length:897 start_codon:yes stop_codon:yes gene_type:complete